MRNACKIDFSFHILNHLTNSEISFEFDRSFDYKSNLKYCYIRSESKNTKYSSFKSDTDSVHYHKNCVPEKSMKNI